MTTLDRRDCACTDADRATAPHVAPDCPRHGGEDTPTQHPALDMALQGTTIAAVLADHDITPWTIEVNREGRVHVHCATAADVDRLADAFQLAPPSPTFLTGWTPLVYRVGRYAHIPVHVYARADRPAS